MPATAFRLFYLRTHLPSSKTATRSSSSEHSILNRLSTTKALLFLSHRTFRLDRLVPGFRRSMTCGGRRREKERERRCRRDRQKRPIVSAILNGPRNCLPSERGRRPRRVARFVTTVDQIATLVRFLAATATLRSFRGPRPRGGPAPMPERGRSFRGRWK